VKNSLDTFDNWSSTVQRVGEATPNHSCSVDEFDDYGIEILGNIGYKATHNGYL
jgi:hypothetical protein